MHLDFLSFPIIGILTLQSEIFCTSLLTPFASFPITTIFLLYEISYMLCSVSKAVVTISNPSFLNLPIF